MTDDKLKAARGKTLNELTALSQELGMYDDTDNPLVRDHDSLSAPQPDYDPRDVAFHNSAPSFLRSALGHMEDRADTYDSPEGERSMGKTVAAFNAITGHQLTEEQGWKFMCLLKLVRSEQGAFRADNFEDLAAYAGLAGESAGR